MALTQSTQVNNTIHCLDVVNNNIKPYHNYVRHTCTHVSSLIKTLLSKHTLPNINCTQLAIATSIVKWAFATNIKSKLVTLLAMLELKLMAEFCLGGERK